MIRLFPADATTFTTQGLGVLNAIHCPVTEERNGVYELELQIAFVDRHYSDIALGRLILSKPNPYEDPEPFRIYQISRPMNGIVTVNACHWSYDLSKLADKPFTASSVTEAISKLKTNSIDTCPFDFVTDKSATGNFTVSVPSSIRSLLGGSEGSILDVFGGGEWKFTGRTCYLYQNRGQDRGVTIRYGKNLTDLTQEENNARVYSKLYPYWADTEGHLVTLPENTLDINQNGNGILVYDMTDKWDAAPTVAQLRTAAQSYINNNNLDTPVVNLTLSFEQISEYIKDAVYLCDTVSVEFPELDVSAKAKVIKTVYDAVLDRYEKIEVGTIKDTLAQTIATLQDTSVTGTVGKSILRESMDRASAQIKGHSGGFLVQNDSDGDGYDDELLFLDALNIADAQEVWRWTLGGLGHSSDGYDGLFTTAITADGHIVADFMDTGTLTASIIKAGILQDEAGLNYWNMETGEVSFNVSGAVDSIVTYYAESTENEAPPWDIDGELFDSNGEEIFGSNNQQIFAIPIWSTTAPTTATDNYRWMRNLVTYKDGTTELTSAVPMQDYYGRANLVLKMTTDSVGNPIGIMSGLADYIKFTAGQLEIDSPQLYLDREGNASFNGAITATSLKLGEGANVDVEKIEGFDGKTEELIEGMVDATYINALKIVAGSVAAEDITGTTISGKRIEGSILYHDDGNFWNLETGEIRINAYSEQFDSLESDISTAKEDISQLELGISVTNSGVTVGRQGADIKGVFSNDSLEFQTANDVPIAWFSSDANEGLGVDMVQVGSHDTTTQRWLIRTDKNGDRLMFTRRAS